MEMLSLIPVKALFRDGAGNLAPVNPANALLAEDFAPKWNAWRAAAKERYGWELLISPPEDGDYTRAMFRSPQDVAYVLEHYPTTAASMDRSTHQAGRAVDLDLLGMSTIYPNYSYTQLVNLAKEFGIFNRVYQLNKTEPWHFDDNPAVIYGTQELAVDAVGNTLAQIQADLAAGRPTPQQRALENLAAGETGLAVLSGLALLGLLVAVTPAAKPKGRAKA